MSTPKARVRRGTTTTPPPRPVREPRNPAISEPRKRREVSSKVFNGMVAPVATLMRNRGDVEGAFYMDRVAAACRLSGSPLAGKRQSIHHRGSAWRVYSCCGAIRGDDCERRFYLRCGADAVWAVWRGALDGADGRSGGDSDSRVDGA